MRRHLRDVAMHDVTFATSVTWHLRDAWWQTSGAVRKTLHLLHGRRYICYMADEWCACDGGGRCWVRKRQVMAYCGWWAVGGGWRGATAACDVWCDNDEMMR